MSFKSVSSGIAARQGVPPAEASAELAASARRASPAAKKRNPALRKVKGKAKGGFPFGKTKTSKAKAQPPKRAGIRRVWSADSGENC